LTELQTLLGSDTMLRDFMMLDVPEVQVSR
jgi:hypothetical protein